MASGWPGPSMTSGRASTATASRKCSAVARYAAASPAGRSGAAGDAKYRSTRSSSRLPVRSKCVYATNGSTESGSASRPTTQETIVRSRGPRGGRGASPLGPSAMRSGQLMRSSARDASDMG